MNFWSNHVLALLCIMNVSFPTSAKTEIETDDNIVRNYKTRLHLS